MTDVLVDKIEQALHGFGIRVEQRMEIAHIAADVARDHYHDTDEHVVVITPKPERGPEGLDWNLQHPLSCREKGMTGLIECSINMMLVRKRSDWPTAGRYSVEADRGVLGWTRLDG